MKKRILIGGMIICGFGATAQSWTELGGMDGLSANQPVLALALDPAGNVYAGGQFYNSASNSYVAKYNGTSWSELGGSNSMNSNLQIYSIVANSANNIYAAGNFHDGNGYQFVDHYNGTSWSAVGTLDFDGEVNHMCTDANGNIYAVGQFQNDQFDYYVAKWNGTSWSELGGTDSFHPSGFLLSVAADAHGNVYVAGHFENGGGNGYVAKFDGTSWTELGGSANAGYFNGFTQQVRVSPAGQVYVTGQFTNASGNYYIAKFDGTSWSEVGGTNAMAANDEIEDFCFDANGRIYAGGGFTNGTGVYVARYNGSSWSNVSSDGLSILGGYISALAVSPDGTHIYAGGGFNNLHGKYYVATLNAPLVAGVAENAAKTAVSVYPNPVVSQLSVTGMTQGDYTITGLDGKTVQTGKLGQSPIAVDKLESGSYILRLTNDQQQQSINFTKSNP